MRVILVLPGLLNLGAPLAGVGALGELAAWSAAPVPQRGGIEAAILAVAGVADGTAPLAARGAGLALTDGDVQYADPITLVAGRDDVLFAGRVDDLARAEADALLSRLNAHFTGDALAFIAPRPDAWFVTSHGIPLPETSALTATDSPIASALPRGAHAKHWRRWLSEMQMLLHEHPVNVEREAAGRPPVNGVWPWGGGPVSPLPALPWTAYAPTSRDGDLARGLAATAQPLPATFAQVARDRDAWIVLPCVATADALPALERDWLAPLVAALHGGTVGEASLVADDRATAFTWRARRPTAWQRLRARFTSPRFTVPASAS